MSAVYFIAGCGAKGGAGRWIALGIPLVAPVDGAPFFYWFNLCGALASRAFCGLASEILNKSLCFSVGGR